MIAVNSEMRAVSFRDRVKTRMDEDKVLHAATQSQNRER
jgi:hypothetical protein